MPDQGRLRKFCCKLLEFRTLRNFCDVEFLVEEKTFFAHKVVLAACSEYFQAMFLGKMSENNKSSIPLFGIKPDIFGHLLEYSYGAELYINSENVEDMVIVADMLQFVEAVEFCVKYMKKQLDSSNCVGIYCFAKQHAFKDLQKAAWEYMQSHFFHVVQEEEFVDTPVDVLLSLVKSEHIAIESETDVLHCVLKWLSHNVRERRKFCVSLFTHVRTNLIPPQEIDKMLTSVADLCLKIAAKVLTKNQSDSFKNQPDQTVAKTSPRKSAKKGFYTIGGCIPEISRRYTWDDSNMDAVSYIERFDSFNKSWDPYPMSLREARTNLAAVALNGKIYAIGGERDSMIYGSIECYDTMLKQWKWDLPSLNIPRCSCQAVATDKDIYILGGFVGTGAGKSIERYDLDANEIKIVNFSMQSERHSFGAVCVDNVIYMAGGIGLSECEMKSVECYDLDRHEWWFANDMLYKRAFFTLVFLRGFIYAIGGHNEIQGTLKSCEVYDMYKNNWKFCSPMSQARAGGFAAVMDKKIIIVGGKVKTRDHNGEMTWKVLQSAEVYDPESDSWSATDKMSCDSRCDGVALVL